MIIHFFEIISIFLLILLFGLSYIGYGKFFNNLIFKGESIVNYGQLGLLGIFFLIVLSYFTSFFIPHNSLHNVLILTIGLFLFFFDKKKIDYQNLRLLFLITIFTFLFFIISKNHDDFPYYHLPFALNLSENKVSFGMGLLNYGYRHHSALLFLNSLKFLPWLKYFLFNLPNYLILIFVNYILLDNLIKNLKKKNIIFLLSLIFLTIINTKFTRLSEYGTDIAGQIILLVIIINFINILIIDKKIVNLYFNIFLLFIVLSFKVYFLIYFLLIPFVFYQLKLNPLKNKNLNLNAIICYLFFISLFIIHNFINTGCVIYPVEITCIGDKFFWSLDSQEVIRNDIWLESWAKAGASPNFQVENLNEYIKGLNWVTNWYKNYFVGKVSDFFFIVILINLIIFFSFNKKLNLKDDLVKVRKILIFIGSLALLIWFFKHPSLRYGGYLPVTIFLTSIFLFFYSIKNTKVNINKITNFFIILIIIIFNTKNVLRLELEFNRNDQYKFDNFPFYTVIDKKYESFSFENETYMYTTNGYCWATPTPCSNTPRKIRVINNYIFFER